MAAELIQIYYRDEQKAHCYHFSRLYFNEKLTIFFENSVIEECILATDKEKIGVASWKLRSKMKYYIGRPREITKELIESDYHVLSFTRNTKHHQMLAAADKWHPGFKEILMKIGAAVGFSVPREVSIPIYQNSFMALTEIYLDYVKNYLSPAMKVMKEDPEINKLIMADSNYSNLDRTSVPGDYLLEKIGVSYYPLAPFLLERLFSVYVHNNKIPVTWL